MKTTVEFLDAVKARQGISSSYALAKSLGFAESRISHYYAGRRFLSDETALVIAELLDMAPGYVLACIAAERAETDVTRKAWSKAAKALAGTAVAIIAGSALAWAPLPAFTPSAEAHGGNFVYYVKLLVLLLILISAARHTPAALRLQLARLKPRSTRSVV